MSFVQETQKTANQTMSMEDSDYKEFRATMQAYENEKRQKLQTQCNLESQLSAMKKRVKSFHEEIISVVAHCGDIQYQMEVSQKDLAVLRQRVEKNDMTTLSREQLKRFRSISDELHTTLDIMKGVQAADEFEKVMADFKLKLEEKILEATTIMNQNVTECKSQADKRKELDQELANICTIADGVQEKCNLEKKASDAVLIENDRLLQENQKKMEMEAKVNEATSNSRNILNNVRHELENEKKLEQFEARRAKEQQEKIDDKIKMQKEMRDMVAEQFRKSKETLLEKSKMLDQVAHNENALKMSIVEMKQQQKANLEKIGEQEKTIMQNMESNKQKNEEWLALKKEKAYLFNANERYKKTLEENNKKLIDLNNKKSTVIETKKNLLDAMKKAVHLFDQKNRRDKKLFEATICEMEGLIGKIVCRWAETEKYWCKNIGGEKEIQKELETNEMTLKQKLKSEKESQKTMLAEKENLEKENETVNLEIRKVSDLIESVGDKLQLSDIEMLSIKTRINESKSSIENQKKEDEQELKKKQQEFMYTVTNFAVSHFNDLKTIEMDDVPVYEERARKLRESWFEKQREVLKELQERHARDLKKMKDSRLKQKTKITRLQKKIEQTIKMRTRIPETQKLPEPKKKNDPRKKVAFDTEIEVNSSGDDVDIKKQSEIPFRSQKRVPLHPKPVLPGFSSVKTRSRRKTTLAEETNFSVTTSQNTQDGVFVEETKKKKTLLGKRPVIVGMNPPSLPFKKAKKSEKRDEQPRTFRSRRVSTSKSKPIDIFEAGW